MESVQKFDEICQSNQRVKESGKTYSGEQEKMWLPWRRVEIKFGGQFQLTKVKEK